MTLREINITLPHPNMGKFCLSIAGSDSQLTPDEGVQLARWLLVYAGWIEELGYPEQGRRLDDVEVGIRGAAVLLKVGEQTALLSVRDARKVAVSCLVYSQHAQNEPVASAS